MKQILTYSVFAIALAALTACSKSVPVAEKPTEGPSPATESIRCANTTVAALLNSIEVSETRKTELDTEAKKSPAKANFRKLFDAEVALGKEIEDSISRLSHCENPTALNVVETLKKKSTASQTQVNYLVESFPDFRFVNHSR